MSGRLKNGLTKCKWPDKMWIAVTNFRTDRLQGNIHWQLDFFEIYNVI
jgi:hypothetical protein